MYVKATKFLPYFLSLLQSCPQLYFLFDIGFDQIIDEVQTYIQSSLVQAVRPHDLKFLLTLEKIEAKSAIFHR